MNKKDLGQVNIFTGLSDGNAEYVAKYNFKDTYHDWRFTDIIYYLKYIDDYKDNILCIDGELFTDMNETKIISVIDVILKKIKKHPNLKLNIVCKTYVQIQSVYLYSKLYDLNIKCFIVDKNEEIKECEDIKETISLFHEPFDKLYNLELDLTYKGII